MSLSSEPPLVSTPTRPHYSPSESAPTAAAAADVLSSKIQIILRSDNSNNNNNNNNNNNSSFSHDGIEKRSYREKATFRR
jgi:hypothetical protein